MSILSYKERQDHWEWCRSFLDHEAFYRVDEVNPVLPGKLQGSTYIWQGYLRRASFNAEFMNRLGLLFWNHFQQVYETQEFQLGACLAAGVPIGLGIQNVARTLGIPVNLFTIRQSPKTFGFDSWFEGIVKLDIPVLLVDDVAASAINLKMADVKLRSKLKIPMHYNYFTILNKVGRGFGKNAQHTENYLNYELISFFTMNHICKNVGEFYERYGKKHKWSGIVR